MLLWREQCIKIDRLTGSRHNNGICSALVLGQPPVPSLRVSMGGKLVFIILIMAVTITGKVTFFHIYILGHETVSIFSTVISSMH